MRCWIKGHLWVTMNGNTASSVFLMEQVSKWSQDWGSVGFWSFVCLGLQLCSFVHSVKSVRSRHFRIANMNTFQPQVSKSEKEAQEVSMCFVSAWVSTLWTNTGCRWQHPVTYLRGELNPAKSRWGLPGLNPWPVLPVLWCLDNSTLDFSMLIQHRF